MTSPRSEWDAFCARGELAFQVAPDGTPVWPPRVAQPGTGAPLRWRVSEGAGTVYATTVLRRAGEPSRNLALVELDEGFRMMSRVVGVEPRFVRVGLRVALRFEDGLPVFAP